MKHDFTLCKHNLFEFFFPFFFFKCLVVEWGEVVMFSTNAVDNAEKYRHPSFLNYTCRCVCVYLETVQYLQICYDEINMIAVPYFNGSL